MMAGMIKKGTFFSFLLVKDINLTFSQSSIIHRVRRSVQEEGFGVFTHLMELTHYLSILIDNSSAMPRVMWNDQHGEELNIDGHLITMTSFRNLYHKLFDETEKLLQKEVLLDCDIPNFEDHQLMDNLSEEKVNYSFISDPRNPFLEHRNRLLNHIFSPVHQNRFVLEQREGKIVWNRNKTSGIVAWVKTCERCLAFLFALFHYGSGQPARGTELATLTWVNTVDHARSIFWFHGMVNIIYTYNKTQGNAGTSRVISRSLPPPVGRLCIIWMALVIPALDAIWANLQPNFTICERSIFSQHVFTGRYGHFETEDFSAILASISGQPVAEGGLGYAMTISTTRHFLIAIVREYLKEMPDKSFLEDFFNEQSGHGEAAAQHYALSFASISGVSTDRLRKFVELSKIHHKLLYDDHSELPPTAISSDDSTCLHQAPSSLGGNIQENEQMANMEAMKRIEEVERMAGAVKDSMVSELNNAVGPVYEKICQIEVELVSLRKLIMQTSQDVVEMKEKQCETTQSLQSCGDGVSTLISLFQKARID